uniref:Uncharacterized protein n=1 Tax=Tetranychus urticae TaxID=32264 RepID=T1L4A4_TETUR
MAVLICLVVGCWLRVKTHFLVVCGCYTFILVFWFLYFIIYLLVQVI